jgi:predicted ATP-dependent serine protease
VGKSTLLLQMAAMLTHASPGAAASSSSNGDSNSSTSKVGRGRAAAAASEQDVEQPAASLQQQQEDEEAEQAAAAAAAGGGVVLYVSGEESVEQIGSRAERMGVAANADIYVYSATRLDAILDEIIRLQPAAVIVDSIQTVYLDEVSSSAGSVTQVRGGVGQGSGFFYWQGC